MANAHRGEIAATLNGTGYTLVLTLGALAELETTFGHEDMLALADRFGSGRISARDANRVIGAGLRGAGYDISDDAVLMMRADNGAAGFIDIVARLLAATFGTAPVSDEPHLGLMARAEVDTTVPPLDSRHPPSRGERISAGGNNALGQSQRTTEGRAPFPGPR